MLDIYNTIIMKASKYLIAVIIGTASISLGVWAYYYMQGGFEAGDLFQFGIIGLLIVFAFYLGFRRLSSERRGQPAEDEMSKRVLQKAASTAYYFSLYMWLIVSYLSDSRDLPTHTWIGLGIVGMAILFAGSWFYHNLKGIDD
jgi:hypothetical protein